MRWRELTLSCAFLVLAVSAEKLRLCVDSDITDETCRSLDRGDSPIKCERVPDSANCAIKMRTGQADFGVFTADELLVAHKFYPTGLQVMAQLRYVDQDTEQFEYQSVVVVPKNYTPSEGGFGALVGSGLCHPGFGRSQGWTDHVMKYFERKVMNNVCRKDVSVAENEIINLKDFFKKGCRPGEWVADAEVDRELKNKHPELCELCDEVQNCSYGSDRHKSHGHLPALECLTSNRGQVAYASLEYVREYFEAYRCIELNSLVSVSYENREKNRNQKVTDYQFLCDNGSVMPLTSQNPCTWVKQLWKVVVAREEVSREVMEKLKAAQVVTYSSDSWDVALSEILFKSYTPILFDNYTTPSHYLTTGGYELELPKSECGNEIRWCTISQLETNKCNWTASAALVLGIRPAISCVQAESLFECFDKISKNEADVISIDSNYGHLARKVYGLSSILYCETVNSLNSVVIGVIRDKAQMKRITSLAEVKNSNACFPEYGGIAWLSFIKVAREHRIIPDSCKYPEIMANLLQKACTPGFAEASHSANKIKPRLNSNNLEKLCDLCPTQANGERCEANPQNAYYGDKGAFDCLKLGNGDIAFLEARNIKAFIENGSINESDYRVLCKNGTLADHTGFDVDDTCALSVTIDSEVISRRKLSDTEIKDITLTLLDMEDWMGYRLQYERRIINIYEPFNSTADLLFKNSIAGLVASGSQVKEVIAYKELFRHVDDCSGATSIFVITMLVIANFITAQFI